MHGIVLALPIFVGGKIVNIEVGIVDASLDYNLLLGKNWMYEMDAIACSLFRIIFFPHEGRIVTVDQLDCSPVDPNASTDSTIPLVDNAKLPVENLGVGMYFSLMGNFDIPPPSIHINEISSSRVLAPYEFLDKQARGYNVLGAFKECISLENTSSLKHFYVPYL